MEGFSRKDEGCHQFLDLIPKEREWVVKSSEENMNGVSEEKKLELRLGPPGEDWIIKKQKNISTQRDYDYDHESLLSLGHNVCAQNPWKHQSNSHFLHLHSQPCTNRVTSNLKISENNTISPANTVLPNTQKRSISLSLMLWSMHLVHLICCLFIRIIFRLALYFSCFSHVFPPFYSIFTTLIRIIIIILNLVVQLHKDEVITIFFFLSAKR